jgi:hypothetical protein
MMGLPRAGRKHLPRHHRIRRWIVAVALAAVGLLFVLWGWWKPTGYIADGLSAAIMFLGIGFLATGVVVALTADERTQKWVIIAALAGVVASLMLCRPF